MRTLDNFLKDVRKIFIVVRAVDASDVAIRHLIRFAGLLPSHPIWMCSVEVFGYAAGIHSRKHNQSILMRGVGQFTVKIAVPEKPCAMVQWELARIIRNDASGVYDHALHRRTFPEFPPPFDVISSGIAFRDIGLAPPDGAAIPRCRSIVLGHEGFGNSCDKGCADSTLYKLASVHNSHNSEREPHLKLQIPAAGQLRCNHHER